MCIQCGLTPAFLSVTVSISGVGGLNFFEYTRHQTKSLFMNWPKCPSKAQGGPLFIDGAGREANASSCRSFKISSCQGFKVAKVSRFRGVKMSGFQVDTTSGFKVSMFEKIHGVKVSRFKLCFKVSRFEDFKVSRSQGFKLSFAS